MSKRVLVTGASGFVGRELVRELRGSNLPIERVIGVSRRAQKDISQATGHDWYEDVHCDVELEQSVARVMLQFQPDIVFHLAANPIVREDAKHPVGITHTNVVSTHNLLAYAKKGCRFILASSATVYGNAEKRCNESFQLEATSVYAATKIASEAYVAAYTKQGKVNGCSARLVANVGDGSTHGVLHDFVRKVKERVPPFPLRILGAFPGSTKPYAHVVDTAKAMVLLAEKPITGPVNIGPNDELNTDQISDLVLDAVDSRCAKVWLGEAYNWPGDQRIVHIDNHLIKSLGWEPRYKTSRDAVETAIKEMAK